MALDTVGSCIQAIRQYRLLTAPQLDEINENLPAFRTPRVLAQELVKAGWLTPFQVNQVFKGQGKNLVLGPYVLVERLGEGGVGHVFKAQHVHMQRYVAIKFLRSEKLDNPEVVARFYREIHAVSQLVHPNVVIAHDAGPFGQTHYLAMEYVEGVDLQKKVSQGEPLGVEQACDYIRQAALGLQHIHERGLVHRDIKPGNLLVTQVETDSKSCSTSSSGTLYLGQSFPWGLIKILDLGLARFDDSDGVASTPLTTAGEGGIRGSADYLAPEQAVDFHAADIRADIYSLGCTLYFLLTGKPPFEGKSLAQKLMMHQRAAPPSLEKLRPGLPRKLDQIIQTTMAKKPEDRFQTPGEMAGAIASVHQARWLSLFRK
jgi:serine/threonine-protein kinase